MTLELTGEGQVVATSSARNPVPTVSDRVKQQEALVIAVMAKNNLAFSIAPKLVSMCHVLATDEQALSKLSLDHTAASYKLTHSLAHTFRSRLVSKMVASPFCLNLDEATSKSNKRVLGVLVSLFDSDTNCIAIHHLDSLELVSVDSESVGNALYALLDKAQIPWKNLIGLLLDSCNVMRGSKQGAETRVRNEKAPHLLDIDGVRGLV